MTETLQSPSTLSAPSKIDELERVIVDNLEQFIPVTEHFFIPGEYIRRIHMPAGSYLTSKTHATRHPFKVTKGRCIVYDELGQELQHITAPYCGITEPGTRRALQIIEDTVWTTYHTNEDDETDLAVIEGRVIIPHENSLLCDCGMPQIEEGSDLT
jgi:hypothetical protein